MKDGYALQRMEGYDLYLGRGTGVDEVKAAAVRSFLQPLRQADGAKLLLLRAYLRRNVLQLLLLLQGKLPLPACSLAAIHQLMPWQ